jgi:hypothetical protein
MMTEHFEPKPITNFPQGRTNDLYGVSNEERTFLVHWILRHKARPRRRLRLSVEAEGLADTSVLSLSVR